MPLLCFGLCQFDNADDVLLVSVEGPWEDVMRVIGQAHTLLHTEKGVSRIQTDIRVGSRYVYELLSLWKQELKYE